MTRDVELLGLELDALTEAQTIDHVLSGLTRGQGGRVCTANLEVLRLYVGSGEVRRLVDAADLVVGDGMPLVWSSRLAGTPLPERVTGSSLIRTLPRAAARQGVSVFLLGGNAGAADGAATALGAEIPGLRIAGTLCPPFGFDRDQAQLERLEQTLRERRPDIVFVALPFVRQERLIARLQTVLPHAWFVGCGVSLSFVTGDVRRAPALLQRMGLEWAHRLAQEPRRLFRRYIVQGLPFMARLLASSLARRLRPRRAARPA